jgi:hypothetical protein
MSLFFLLGAVDMSGVVANCVAWQNSGSLKNDLLGAGENEEEGRGKEMKRKFTSLFYSSQDISKKTMADINTAAGVPGAGAVGHTGGAPSGTAPASRYTAFKMLPSLRFSHLHQPLILTSPVRGVTRPRKKWTPQDVSENICWIIITPYSLSSPLIYLAHLVIVAQEQGQRGAAATKSPTPPPVTARTSRAVGMSMTTPSTKTMTAEMRRIWMMTSCLRSSRMTIIIWPVSVNSESKS